jgi:hypothetical protein
VRVPCRQDGTRDGVGVGVVGVCGQSVFLQFAYALEDR